ncbi:MAG: GAF domain-containing protein, partial [bacterium]
ILERAVVHIPDAELDPEFRVQALSRAVGWRSGLFVPMLREGAPIGAVAVSRAKPGPFSDNEIELLKTFADQAVIAVENVRLFTELQEKNEALTDAHAQVTESLEQQTATSEILRIISTSPTDLQPVLDAVAENAARLCAAYDALIFRLDGDVLRRAAHSGPIPAPLGFVIPATRSRVTGRAVLNRQPVQVADAQAESEEFPETKSFAREHGFRTILSVPLMREGIAIGTIDLRRTEVRPFSDSQIALLKTFADQAVIAIENVRLFTELEARNRDLTEALEQQTATSEILGVISSSPTDTQPVFDAIAANAARLCSANDAQVLRVEGEVLRLIAASGAPSMPSVRQLTRGHLVGRAVIDRKTIHVRDLAQAMAEYPETTAAGYGVQSALAVPLLREGVALGVIRISRTEIQPFTDSQIALLQTFADQAVIAIQNVRLFKELEVRNRELTVALAQQTATSEVLAVISGAQTDVQPVFEAIVQSARRLCDASYSSIYRLDDQLVHLIAHNHETPEAAKAIRDAWPMPLTGDSFVVRAIRKNSVIHTDMQADPTASAALIARGKALGHRRIVVVPMVREGQPIGAIHVSRGEATPFTEQHIALLQTFADQAVIAIENVRLLTELQASNREIVDKSRQLEAASQHKSEFLANMQNWGREPGGRGPDVHVHDPCAP